MPFYPNTIGACVWLAVRLAINRQPKIRCGFDLFDNGKRRNRNELE